VKDFFLSLLAKLLRQMVDYLAELTYLCRYHSPEINLSLCSGVAVMLSVSPASPSVETLSMPPGIMLIPASLPTDSHPHSTHIITYRRCQGLRHLVMTYLLLGKLALEPLCNLLVERCSYPF
jgi:hypothetical protein